MQKQYYTYLYSIPCADIMMKLPLMLIYTLLVSVHSFKLKSSFSSMFRPLSRLSMSSESPKDQYSSKQLFPQVISSEKSSFQDDIQIQSPFSSDNFSFGSMSLPILLSLTGLIFFSNPMFASAETLSFDPALFQPVCHFSDIVYQFLKSAVGTL